MLRKLLTPACLLLLWFWPMTAAAATIVAFTDLNGQLSVWPGSGLQQLPPEVQQQVFPESAGTLVVTAGPTDAVVILADKNACGPSTQCNFQRAAGYLLKPGSHEISAEWQAVIGQTVTRGCFHGFVRCGVDYGPMSIAIQYKSGHDADLGVWNGTGEAITNDGSQHFFAPICYSPHGGGAQCYQVSVQFRSGPPGSPQHPMPPPKPKKDEGGHQSR